GDGNSFGSRCVETLDQKKEGREPTSSRQPTEARRTHIARALELRHRLGALDHDRSLSCRLRPDAEKFAAPVRRLANPRRDRGCWLYQVAASTGSGCHRRISRSLRKKGSSSFAKPSFKRRLIPSLGD